LKALALIGFRYGVAFAQNLLEQGAFRAIPQCDAFADVAV
jgi:hypothetical protein